MTHLVVDLDPLPAETSEGDRAVTARATAIAAVPTVDGVQLYVPSDDGERYLTLTETSDIDVPAPSGAGERRRYQPLAEWINDGYTPAAATHLQAVWMAVDDPDDLARWYADEHIALLFRVPGWLRSRRFRLESGSGPEFLALHDLAGPSVATDPIGDAARSTPWRDRVMGYTTAYVRANFVRLLRLP